MSTIIEVLVLVASALIMWLIASWLWHGFKLRQIDKKIRRAKLIAKYDARFDEIEEQIKHKRGRVKAATGPMQKSLSSGRDRSRWLLDADRRASSVEVSGP